MRELEIGVKDLAGNVTRIPLKLARSKDHPEVKLLAPGGAEPITRDDVIAVGKPRLLVVVGNEAAGFQSVHWFVKRALARSAAETSSCARDRTR